VKKPPVLYFRLQNYISFPPSSDNLAEQESKVYVFAKSENIGLILTLNKYSP